MNELKYCSKCVLSEDILWPAAAVYWSCVGRTGGSSEDRDFGLFDYVTACVRVRSSNTATLPDGGFHVKGRSSRCRRSLIFLMKSPLNREDWRKRPAG